MIIKRIVSDKAYIRKLLNLKTNEQLKQICRDFHIRGFSKYGKNELVDFVHRSLTREQLQEIFEIPIKEIYTRGIKTVITWNLKEINAIMKEVYLRNSPYVVHADIEKKHFKNIEIKGYLEGTRLDFTLTFIMKLRQPYFARLGDGTEIWGDSSFSLRKEDFISVEVMNQESNIAHKIIKINFGEFPRNLYLENMRDWLALAEAHFRGGIYYEAINLYEFLLSDFELPDDIRAELIENLKEAKKKFKASNKYI